MLKILREFIKEELTWNYWMRRPRNNQVGDVSDELEKGRKEMFATAKEDLAGNVQQLRHKISIANDLRSIKDALSDFGESPDDLAQDPTTFARAAKDGDIDEVRRQILTGLERWETEMAKWAEHDDYDTSTLSGHPMRTVKMGGSAFKRPNGP